MAYPTAAQLSWKATDAAIGAQPITETSTTLKHPLGTTVTARDFGTLGYGEGKFIYLKGVASTAAGDMVVYDAKAGTTTRTVAASRGPIAVAASANVALQYGWYQIFGNAAVSSTAGTAGSSLAITATDGRATNSTAAAAKVEGAVFATATNTPSTAFSQAVLSYPSANGNT